MNILPATQRDLEKNFSFSLTHFAAPHDDVGVGEIFERVESVGIAMATGMKQQNIIHLEGIRCGHCVLNIYVFH